MRRPLTRILTSLGLALGTLLATPAWAAPSAPPASQYVVVRDAGASTIRDADYRTLASMYAYTYDGQTDDVSIARPELTELGFVATSTEYPVDRDFVACLDQAGVTATSSVGAPAPIFVRGQPW